MRATVLGGYEDLEVAGESHFQDNLWRLAGGRHKAEVRVRMDVHAMLLAEEDNPYDAATYNPVSVPDNVTCGFP